MRNVPRPVLGLVAATLAALAVPLVVPGNFALTFGFQFMVWLVLAVSWNVFSGNAGYPSFGHGVFFGIGIYTAAVLLTRTALPFWAIVPLSGVAAALVAGALGAVMFLSSRFRGDLFGLVTLALAFVTTTVVANTEFIDGGQGVFVRDEAARTFVANDPLRLYLIGVAIAVVTMAVSYAISAGPWGTALTAIRDEESVAESLGVPTYRYKVGTFALSAGLAGVIGAPQAIFLGYVEVGAVFALSVPLYVIMMAILGGVNRWFGPVLGAALVVGMRELLLGTGSPELSQIAIGALLIVVIVVLPGGLGGLLRRHVPRGART